MYRVLKKDIGFVEIKSEDIKMGDLILIESNMRIPADIIVLCTD
jgi:magnesium-transporting ATPase (P-type)